MGNEIFIPIIFFLVTGGIIGVYFLTRHKERMTMIDKGMNAEDIKSLYQKQMVQVNPLSSLKWGMVLLCVGVAIIIGIWLRDNYVFNDGIIPGMIATFGGIALVLFYFIAGKRQQ
jgi:Na+/glutamate symporter